MSPVNAADRHVGEPAPPVIDHEPEDCLEPVPQAASVAAVTDHGKVVSLDVLVLGDGVTKSRAADVMSTMARAFSPLRIRVKMTYKPVKIPGSGEALELRRGALKAVGGARPRGYDVVYVMTSKDIHSNGDSSGAGFAFCIGGVRYPHLAFAVGEGVSPLERFFRDSAMSAKIAAHEIGHLLGAHHHYGNCVEGNGSTAGGGEPSICTLMWPAVLYYMALNFGTLESTVIRGHAVRFASP